MRITGRAAPALAVAAAVLAVAACGSSQGPAASPGSTASAGTPVQGGTLTYDMEIAPQCADPEVSPQFAAYQLARPVVDSLVASSDGVTFKPWLATSWTISPNAEHYTFTLRKGVTFADGTPVNAAAVKANFDRIHNPATKSEYAVSLLGPYYQSTTVLGPDKVEVNFSQGFNSFLWAASTANLGIQSPKALAKNAPCSPPVGSGPFVISKYNAQTGATLTRRADYEWGPATSSHRGPAYLSAIVMNYVTNDTTRVGSLTSGQVDSIEAPTPTDVSSLQRQGFQIINHSQPGGVYDLYIDETEPLLQNVKARLAIRDALNVPQMIEALYDGVYQPAWGPIAASTPGYDPAVANSWGQNTAQAEQYLDQLGYTKTNAAGFRVNAQGKEFTVQLVGGDTRELRPELSLLIKQEEAKVGINVSINTSLTANEQLIYTGGFGLTASAHVEASPDILRVLFDGAELPGAGGLNYGQVKSPELDGWLAQATSTLSPAEQDKLYGEAQVYVDKNALSIPLYQEETLNAATSKLHGVTFDATGYVLYYDAWLAH